MKSLLLLWVSAMYSSLTVTQYVDDLEPLLRANRDAYLAGPHTPGRQIDALRYFDQQWAWLHSSQGCGSRLLGSAGERCRSERARNGHWPWETYYRDPIANTRDDN